VAIYVSAGGGLEYLAKDIVVYSNFVLTGYVDAVLLYVGMSSCSEE
jgi:hypothetical protein